MQLIKKIWNGELPLFKVYWIYGVLVGLIIRVIVESSYYFIALKYLSVFSYTLVILVVAYQLLLSVGIWRSADAYQKNKVWPVLAKIGAVLGLIMAAGLLVNTFKGPIESTNELKESIELLNKTLPSQIDKDTRLDRVDSENNSFNLHYTLVNYINSKELVDLVTANQTGNLIKNACGDEQLRALLNKNIPVDYIYSDKLGAEITRIVVDKTKCTN